MAETLIATSRAAELLGIPERTLRLHLKEGRIAGRKQGRRWMLSLASVQELAAERGIEVAKPPGLAGPELPLPPPPT